MVLQSRRQRVPTCDRWMCLDGMVGQVFDGESWSTTLKEGSRCRRCAPSSGPAVHWGYDR